MITISLNNYSSDFHPYSIWYLDLGFAREEELSSPSSYIHQRAKQIRHLKEEYLTEPEFHQLQLQRIEALDVGAGRTDVSRFVKDVVTMKIYFHAFIKHMCFAEKRDKANG